MNAKFTLAIIALVGIGVFALPSTMSLFAGQHSFYNIDATGNQVPCQKCHGDVKAELSSNGNTNPALGPITPGPHAAFKCEYCHRIEAGSASGDNAYGQIKYSSLNGNVSRTIVVYVADMEAKNIPASFLLNATLAQAKANPAVNGASTSAVGAISNCIGGKGTPDKCLSEDPTTVLYAPIKSSWKLVSTYNMTLGLPKDTNVTTADFGFDVSKITFTPTAPTGTKAGSVTDVLDGAGSKAVNPGASYHAASLVSCMECHGGEEPMGHYTRVVDGTVNGGVAQCSNCHYGGSDKAGSNRFTNLGAGGFGLTGVAADTGATEAHNAWVTTNDTINRFGGPDGREANNGACVGCHTHVAIDINFQKGYKLAFNATESALGKYEVGPATVEGHVDVSIYGNGSGATYAVGDKSYTWTSSQPMYINGVGAATVLNLNGESSDSAEALQ